MIQLSGITKDFGGQPVLDNISLRILPGERVSLIGPGGCGKSTLLKILLGLTPISSGHVNVLGIDMIEASEMKRNEVLKKMGIAFQQGGLFDFMTVEENIAFALQRLTSLSAAEIAEKIPILLQGVRLAKAAKKFPYELSGGMQRRVGIARALCNDPLVSLFDEPTSGLDPVTSTIILNMILELGQNVPNASMLVCTSNVEIAIRFAKRIVVLNGGKIIADGPWQDLLLEGPEWVKHFLGVRLIGLDREYIEQMQLPKKFIEAHWQ